MMNGKNNDPPNLYGTSLQIANGDHHDSSSSVFPNSYDCPKCKRKFLRKHDYQLHFEVTHLGLSPFKCICNKIFSRKSEFEEHKKEHQRLLDLEVKTAAVKHKKCGRGVNTEKDDRVCQVCHKRFSHKYGCKLHYRTVHLNLKPFQCEFCEMCFSQKIGLIRHGFACEKGTRKKNYQIKLNVMKKQTSTAIPQGKVQQRNKKLNLPKLQLQRKKIISPKRQKATVLKYNQEKQNTDKEQTKKRASSKQLKQEELAGNDQEPPSSTQCSVCKKVFSSESSCRRHYLCVHLKFRLYKCFICGQEMSETRILRKHFEKRHPDADISTMVKKSKTVNPLKRRLRRGKADTASSKQPNCGDSCATTETGQG